MGKNKQGSSFQDYMSPEELIKALEELENLDHELLSAKESQYDSDFETSFIHFNNIKLEGEVFKSICDLIKNSFDRLEKLRLLNVGLNDERVKIIYEILSSTDPETGLSQFSNLREVDFSNNKLTNDCLSEMIALKVFVNRVILHNNDFDTEVDEFKGVVLKSELSASLSIECLGNDIVETPLFAKKNEDLDGIDVLSSGENINIGE